MAGKESRRIVELRRTPSLGALYPKALLGGLLPGDEGLGATEFVRSGMVVDPARLAAYNRVCRFRLSDELPATYPHVLAFPLQLALMSERAFPFPVLGTVHIANRTTQHRPVRLDESFTVRVRAGNLRPHQRGRQFDLLSELIPAGADSPVWTDVSTYLHRGGGSGPTGDRERLVAPSQSTNWLVPSDIGRRYAEVSGDRNPIHLHPLTARLFGGHRTRYVDEGAVPRRVRGQAARGSYDRCALRQARAAPGERGFHLVADGRVAGARVVCRGAERVR